MKLIKPLDPNASLKEASILQLTRAHPRKGEKKFWN
jgi:hypothetical protein